MKAGEAIPESEAERIERSIDVMQRLPPDLVLMKIENETIMTMAASRPRDHKKIKEEIVAQLEAYPSFAAEAIYNKPVGRDPDTHEMKFAEGLSIRAAESIREAYGYNRVGTTLDPIPDSARDEYRLTATFVDYQKGMVWQDSEIVTPWYKSRQGKMVRMPDDRFFNVFVKARRSILVREVILRSVPAGLKSELFEMASRLMDEKLNDATVQKIMAEFGKINVTREMLEKMLGRTTANWSQTDKKTIAGLWQAIGDGETTVAEAFDVPAPDESASTKEAPASQEPGAITADDLKANTPKAEPAKEKTG